MNRIWIVFTIFWIANFYACVACVQSGEPFPGWTSFETCVDSTDDGQTGSSTASAESILGDQDPTAPKQEPKQPDKNDQQGDAPKQIPGKDDNASDESAAAKQAEPADVQLEQLMEKYSAANAKHVDKVQKANPKDQMRLWIAENPLNEMAPEFMAIVTKYPKSDAALKALTVLIAQGTGDIKKNAVQQLIDRYVDDPRILRMINSVSVGLPSPYSESWLQQIAAKSTNKDIQGKAIRAHIDYIRSVREVRDFAKTNPTFTERAGEEVITYLEKYDFEKAENDKLQLLTRLSKNFADVPSEIRGKSYGQIADGELFIINYLSVGKTPPDIAGQDLQEQPFKLSDYRGKVILLTFWGDWCRPCKAMYPQVRSLVKKLADKPFALIGVNSDKDRDGIQKIMQTKQLDWRNFWNGPKGTQGPISDLWSVNAWPTIYVLDAKGVIRYKNVRREELDNALTKLMAEMGHEVDLSDHSDGELPGEAAGQTAPANPGSGGITIAPPTGARQVTPSTGESTEKALPDGGKKEDGKAQPKKDDGSK